MPGPPPRVSDAEVLRRTAEVIGEVGPARFTLADVARATGLAPATLVKRFGSKRGLMLALARQRAGDVRGEFAMARAWEASPLEAMFEVLAGFVAHADTPEALAHHLAFAQVEPDDADFHAAAFESARTMLDGIRALLEQAVQAGELAPCDAESVARTVQTTYNGALVTWAVYRQGALAEWLRGEIEAVLEPWLPPLERDAGVEAE